jgi:hypothetical protein
VSIYSPEENGIIIFKTRGGGRLPQISVSAINRENGWILDCPFNNPVKRLILMIVNQMLPENKYVLFSANKDVLKMENKDV